MTVPAFSLSVVLPGAPAAPAGRGASGPADGLFEGLLAGQVDGAVVAGTAGKARPSPGGLELDPTDETDLSSVTPPQDAGLALLLAVPGAAPVLTPTSAGSDESGEAADLAARQIRVPGLAVAGSAPEPSSDIVPPADLASTRVAPEGAPGGAIEVPVSVIARPDPTTRSEPSTRPETALPADVAAVAPEAFPLTPETGPAIAPPRADTPARPVADVPAPAKTAFAADAAQAVAREAGLATPVAPPALAVAAPVEPAVLAAASAQALETPARTETLPPAPTTGDLRRAAAARGDRRPASTAGAAGVAAVGESPVRQAAQAALDGAHVADIADATPTSEPDAETLTAEAADESDTQQPILPGEARAAAAQTAAAGIAVAAPRGSPETVAKLAADIIRKLDGQSTRFDLELNPHGMGKIDVAIEIDRAGKLTAAMTFDTAQSAAELRGRSAELRQALEQAGFSVSDGGLTFDTAGQNAGFGGRDTARQQQQDRAWNGRAFQRAQSGADAADIAGVSPNPSSWTRSGVDIRI